MEDIGGYTHDPHGFARYAWGWGEDWLGNSTGPRDWQREVLQYIGSQLQNPTTRHTPIRIAVASGHGIGKSATIAMVICWALSTCEDTKIVVTANTGTQLATKTVPEVHKWIRTSINGHWWERKATSITVTDLDHAKLWRSDFLPWSSENSEAFAGLHNKGKRIVLIFDEASAIDSSIWEVAEGALTDTDTEIIWLAFGNPTQNVGRFRECFGKFKHRWKTFQIDSRNVDGTNKEEISKWISDYGEDSDFVRVRVRGEFPRAGSNQFISSDVVSAARKYKAVGYDGLPKIMAIDVARFGDDQTVIGKRQGRYSAILSKHRGLDTVQVAERVIEWIIKEQPDAVVVDGDGLGAGVVDQIRVRGYGQKLFEFHSGATASDPQKYFNKIAECWGLMRDWLDNAQIPDDPELASQLESREYGFSNKGQIQLEKKADLKARGLDSPDLADQLAMSFGVQVNIPRREPKEERFGGRDAEFGWMAS